jgi:hypothetical protein
MNFIGINFATSFGKQKGRKEGDGILLIVGYFSITWLSN